MRRTLQANARNLCPWWPDGRLGAEASSAWRTPIRAHGDRTPFHVLLAGGRQQESKQIVCLITLKQAPLFLSTNSVCCSGVNLKRKF